MADLISYSYTQLSILVIKQPFLNLVLFAHQLTIRHLAHYLLYRVNLEQAVTLQQGQEKTTQPGLLFLKTARGEGGMEVKYSTMHFGEAEILCGQLEHL